VRPSEDLAVIDVAALLINGAALGAAYALVTLGFVLILKATGAVNFAHGELVMTGGLLAALAGSALELPGLALLPLVTLVMALVGLALAAGACLPLRRRPPVALFISTIAVGIMLQDGALLLAGPAPRAAPALIGSGSLSLAGLEVGRQACAVIAIAVLAIAAQAWLFQRTQLGRRLRAAAEDPEMARACGIPVTRLLFVTFALASAQAGLAGLLLAHQFFVTPGDGAALMLKAYLAVTLGGWGSLPGAVVGALLVALFETLVAATVSNQAALGGLYLMVLAILLLRPQGLFSEAARRRA